MSLFRINTNVSALNAQRQLRSGNQQLAEAQERLSSGLRINSAADDAAGLAISQKNTTQIQGLQQASTNAQDGISMIQTAEGGLEETQNSLQRMRELAVQASNDTLTESDREQIQREVDALADEIQRISDQTQFNTKNLLNGDLEEGGAQGTQQLQVGANEGQTIEFNISDMGTSSEALDVAGDGEVSGENFDNIKMAVKKVDSTASANDKGKLRVEGEGDDQKLVAANSNTKVSGTTVSKGTVIAESVEGSSRKFSTTKAGGMSGDGKYEFNVAVQEGAKFDATTAGDLITNAGSDYKSSKIDTKKATAQDITLKNSTLESGDYSISVSKNSTDLTKATVTLTDSDGNVVGSQKASKLEKGLKDSDNNVVAKFDSSQLEIDGAGTTSLNEANKVNEEFAFTSKKGVDAPFGGPDITSPEDASKAITTLDNAINAVSSERAELGALQNRLETTISVDDITAENLQAARSRIRDADVAQESVKQTRGNILVQAGTSVLAQANQNPQSALQLLGG